VTGNKYADPTKPMTVEEQTFFGRLAGAGFELKRPMTAEDSKRLHEIALHIYQMRERLSKIGDHHLRNALKKALKDAEGKLTREMFVTFQLPQFTWSDGLSLEVVMPKPRGAGRQPPPNVEISWKKSRN
jgi:hypothetical protein